MRLAYAAAIIACLLFGLWVYVSLEGKTDKSALVTFTPCASLADCMRRQAKILGD